MLTAKSKKKLESYLREDAARGDPSSALVPNAHVHAVLRAEDACVLAGMQEAQYLFKKNHVKVKAYKKDGTRARKGQKIMGLQGRARDMLKVERTALNILGRMSGVATECAKAAAVAKPYGVRIAVTRKTMPGFMQFDKKAAEIGGVWQHRPNLSSGILVKENHFMVEKDIHAIVKRALKSARIKRRLCEIEVETLSEAKEAVKAGARMVMLDNLTPSQAARALKTLHKVGNGTKIEISGGVTLKNLKAYCKTRPDIISMGSLTRNAPMLDFSLRVTRTRK